MRSRPFSATLVVAPDELAELGTASSGNGKPLVGDATSGEEEDGVIPLARRCSSSCLSAGKGNSFESAYLRKSAEAGGTGERPPAGADCGGSDVIDAEADTDCMTGGCICCLSNTPAPGESPFSSLPLLRLAPLSRLTLESVLYLLSRALRLFVRDRRPLLEPVRVNAPFIFSQVLMPSPGRFGVDSARASSQSG